MSVLHTDGLFLLPGVESRLLFAGARETESRSHVADIKHRLIAHARVVGVLSRLQTSELMVISLRVAVIDECEPELEGINLGARAARGNSLQRLCQRARVFAVAVHIDSACER